MILLYSFINYIINFFTSSSRTPNDRSDLMVKKLRYYARFIVVCLLLKKMKLVRDLVRELSKLIGRHPQFIHDSELTFVTPKH